MNKFYKTMVVLYGIALFSSTASAQILTESTLLGRWQCESILPGSLYSTSDNFFQPGWQLQGNGLTVVLKSELKFSQEKAGEFSVTSTAPSPVDFSYDQAVQSAYQIKGDQLIFQYGAQKLNSFFSLKQSDENHLTLTPTSGGYLPVIMCNRTGTAATTSEPAAPTTTTAAATAKQDAKKSAKVE